MNSNSQALLVVEDSDGDYEATYRSLRRACIANPIIRCVDGDDALDYLYHRGRYESIANWQLPGVILLDLNLPGTDGREVLKELKEHPKLKRIPVIVLTTSTDERDIEACYSAGANTYMNKRIDVTSFMEAIQRMSDFWLEIAILPKSQEREP